MTFLRVLTLTFFVNSYVIIAQNNAVKLVLAPGNLVMANNVAFSYERKLNDRFSGSLKYNFSSKKNVPLKSTLSSFASRQMNSYKFNNDLFDDEFISSGISLELRFYTSSTAISGLYLSSFLGFQKTKVSDFNFFYLDPLDPEGSIG